jgi:hypothetical protein
MRQPKHQQLAPRISVKKLTARSHGISQLIKQAESRKSLTELFNDAIPEQFKNKFQINSLNDGVLVITCHSASLMTKLRFSQNKIIEQLNQKLAQSPVTSIKIKIRPKHHQSTGLKSKTERNSGNHNLSKKNAQILTEEAEHTDDIKLKNILLRLAQHSE